MDNKQIKSALQDLIYRLQDAEKGFSEIEKATSNPTLKKWLSGYSIERHQMHRTLEGLSASLGGDAQVDTTFLGDLHRMFIDIKINNTSMENEFDAVVNEIERGSTTLISDYQKVLSDVQMPANFVTTLNSQKETIKAELNALVNLKEEFNSSPIS